MANSVRGIHVSPGIYTAETELTYAVKSLGITTLGLVGETQRGPAFEPMAIENWRQFQSVFGGTSTEKFKDTLYPKYELPYIAKSYLSESNQLQVCRVLGLSGYNAGPAWVITMSSNVTGDAYDNSVVAVLRSRGYYESYYKPQDGKVASEACGCQATVQYDYQRFLVGEKSDGACNDNTLTPRNFDLSTVTLSEYMPIDYSGDECDGYDLKEANSDADMPVLVAKCSVNNYGKFNINIKLSPEFTSVKEGDDNQYDYIYAVSLNPNDKDYILKVLGNNNDDGSAPLYVESLYDVALKQGIESNRIRGIKKEMATFAPALIGDVCTIAPVSDLLTKPEGSLVRGDVGKRFVADAAAVASNNTYHPVTSGGTLVKDEETGDYKKEVIEVGKIYIVKQFTMPNGKRKYFYVKTIDELAHNVENTDQGYVSDATKLESGVVKVNSKGLYYRFVGGDVVPVTVDLNNYKSQYSFASTPWFVSNVKGDYSHIEVNRLFRFHTISDGNSSNYEVKVSIENIRPDEGVFDVVVRNINDTDDSPMPLEKFSKCNLIPGDSKFIGFKIGTFDGEYESRSQYITVELYNDGTNVIAANSVPCGFMGYPHGFNQGYSVVGTAKNEVKPPVFKYNTNFDEDIKARKQYFGLSSIVGVDIDSFTYKGVTSYVESPDYLTNGFHLDCRLNPESYGTTDEGLVNKNLKITVDGQEGFSFDTVSVDARTMIYENSPIIGTEDEMMSSIYEMQNLRKFTCYFYGGFDGWDAYRKSRTNTDDFIITKYKGKYSDTSGEGYAFDRISDAEGLGLNQQGITSDFYAYLAAYRKFANPESTDINIFATPGIDIINNKTLVQEVIEMIEEERADSIYVVTMPDKPAGASDYVDEMLTPEDAVYALEDSEINSNYTCTYFPWVKYFDSDNSQYIYLPATKDVVRNMAQTDNTAYPWFAPAGLDRGDVNCVRAHYVTKLADEDTLYAGRINPIKTFAQDGVKVWGQKNLQVEESQLNRIAVRRLLLRMRKLISIACLSLIFSPNDATTKQSLQGIITPILDQIRSNRGISDYRVEISSSNATMEDRRELNARILFKPYAALEYISLTFAVTDEGVDFDAI